MGETMTTANLEHMTEMEREQFAAAAGYHVGRVDDASVFFVYEVAPGWQTSIGASPTRQNAVKIAVALATAFPRLGA